MDLLKILNLNRHVESNQWVPIEEAKEGLVILCLDPERVKSSRIVQNVFPSRKLAYRVTTLKEFRETLKAFYGAEAADTGDIGDMLSDLEEDEVAVDVGGDDDVPAAADNEPVRLSQQDHHDAYNQGASDIHIEPLPRQSQDRDPLRKTGRCFTSRFPVPTETPLWRIKIMCDPTFPRSANRRTGKSNSRNSVHSTSSCAWQRSHLRAASKT